MRTRFIVGHFLLCIALSGLAAGTCVGSPQLDVAVGFDAQVLRGAYAPFRIEVQGLAAPVEGSLIVRQTLGLPGERRAEVVHVVASGTIENGVAAATLPIVEPLNPIAVELQSSDGRTLAVLEKSLRLGIRQWAFPVAIGRSAGIASAAVVGSAELPSDWWAYDAAREVWLIDPPISEAALEALGEWTVSGGSLVILAGSSFPLIDSPTLRKILPIAGPRLAMAEDNVFYVSGTLRAGALETMWRGTRPLLIQMPLGAGTVSLVSVALEDLSGAELRAVGEKVPPTQRPPTTERVSAALLRSTDVPRPSYAAAPIVTGVVLLALAGYAWLGTRHRWALGVLLGIVLSTAVWSGIYANVHKRFVRAYSMITNVSVGSSFAINTAFASFYAVEPRALSMRHELGSFPAGGLVVAARGGTVTAESEPGETRFFLQAAEKREFLFHSRPQIGDLRFRLDGDRVDVENRTGRILAQAYLAWDGAILPLSPIQMGIQSLPARGGPFLVGEARAAYLALRSILRPIEEWLPLERRSAWLVIVEEERQAVDRNAPELEREVFITILEADAS
jgi:hypothetical protein